MRECMRKERVKAKQSNLYMYMNKSGGPEQARQTVDSCFELVGSHQRCVCTSCSGRTGFMYPKVSLLIVVSGIHPPQTAELHLREKPHLKNMYMINRESEPSQVVVLCCLALFIVSQLFNQRKEYM